MLTVVIPTAEVSRTGGKRLSLSSATTVVASAKSVTSAGRSWLKHDMDRVRNGAGGDYILIGASTDAAPPDEADEIRQIVQFADTFERLADDFALITGV